MPIDALKSLLGPLGLITEPADTAAYAEDWRKLYRGHPRAVLRPGNTERTRRRRAHLRRRRGENRPARRQHLDVRRRHPQRGRQRIHPLALPHEPHPRHRPHRPDTDRRCRRDTQSRHRTPAEEAGCLLPLSIGSEGTAQIGGVLSTNAGGNNTVRYGNARDLVLGLEVVLPDGEIWHGLPATPEGQHRLLPAPVVRRRRRGHSASSPRPC
jgi:hypothetical protein